MHDLGLGVTAEAWVTWLWIYLATTHSVTLGESVLSTELILEHEG